MKRMLLVWTAAALLGGQDRPTVVNARQETRAGAGDLGAQLRSTTPAWFGYAIKTTRRDESCCWSNSDRGCFLEGDGRGKTMGVRGPGTVHLEGTTEGAVLYRVANNQVEKVQVVSMGCPLEAGGLPFIWLTGVSAQSSIAELRQLATAAGADRLTDGAVMAIAQHDDNEADTVLNNLAAANGPERLREKTAFWLGASRGAKGVRTLQEMLKNDGSAQVRDKVVFALSISKQPEALDTLLQTAKTDASAHVRGQALFWLAQKAGKQAEAAISNAVENDPDTEVKKKAVFALSQLPKDEGVPKLIDVARRQPNNDVRKQAFFWLGQSGDPRALAFIEQTLAK